MRLRSYRQQVIPELLSAFIRGEKCSSLFHTLERLHYVGYRAVAARRTANLFAAGRCCGAGQTGWDLLRVIPACAVTGEAAGVAAAMLALGGAREARGLDMKSLQAALCARRVLMDPRFTTNRHSAEDTTVIGGRH